MKTRPQESPTDEGPLAALCRRLRDMTDEECAQLREPQPGEIQRVIRSNAHQQRNGDLKRRLKATGEYGASLTDRRR